MVCHSVFKSLVLSVTKYCAQSNVIVVGFQAVTTARLYIQWRFSIHCGRLIKVSLCNHYGKSVMIRGSFGSEIGYSTCSDYSGASLNSTAD